MYNVLLYSDLFVVTRLFEENVIIKYGGRSFDSFDSFLFFEWFLSRRLQADRRPFEVRQASVSASTGIRLEMDAHAIRHLSFGNIGKFRIIVLSLYIVETIMVKFL